MFLDAKIKVLFYVFCKFITSLIHSDDREKHTPKDTEI